MILNSIRKKIKWEFWPMWLANLPVGLIWLFFSFRARNLFFFSTVNHRFENGAMMGASKINILNHIPKSLLPKTRLIKSGSDKFMMAINAMNDLNLAFPIILKPDIGERGLLVELIKSEQELKAYLESNDINFILQEYIDYPNEAGIFYYRMPNEPKGKIVSIALKNYLSITGDGNSTWRELLGNHFHGALQIDRLKSSYGKYFEEVLEKGKKVIIEPIGNHCRGTQIVNGNHLIDVDLSETFDSINQSMKDVYYGRYDIKYNSWEELKRGENFKIIELNGIASEPMHIYDEQISIVKKYAFFYGLWKVIFKISKMQRAKGIQPISFREAWFYIRSYIKYIRSINKQWRDNIIPENYVLTPRP